MTYDLAIKKDNKIVKLCTVGFSNSGFFIGNFISLGGEALEEKCLAFKIKINQVNNGTASRRGYLFRRISIIPKYSHHHDGFADFSETGAVVSGIDPITKMPKGLGTSSFPLNTRNDGGSFAGLMIWGMEHLPSFTPSYDTIIISPETEFKSSVADNRKKNAISIEFLYTLKSETKNLYNSYFLNYFSLPTGPRFVQILPTPHSYAGQLCVCITSHHSAFDSSNGFVFVGGPGKRDSQNFCEQLSMVYPDPVKYKDLQNLDLTDIFKVQSASRNELNNNVFKHFPL